MTNAQVHNITVGDFTADAVHEGAAITVVFKGNADSGSLTALEATLPKIHEEAQARGVKEVVVDFRALEFMNSSCFKVFVTWLSRVQELEADAQYRIRFLSDEGKHWQRRSLTALSCFAVDLVSVEK